MEIYEHPIEYDNQIIKFLNITENQMKLREMLNRNKTRLELDMDSLRKFNQNLSNELIKNPIKIIPLFETQILEMIGEMQNLNEKKKQQKFKITEEKLAYRVTFEGSFGNHMISPRGLNSELTNQLVCVQGIVTKMSIVRNKLIKSIHYCEETKQGTVKEYIDQYSIDSNQKNNMMSNMNGNISRVNGYFTNTVPQKDINGNPLSFEYGLSEFKDFQILLLQEPPERTPIGQLPRSVEVILEEDLVDKVKPGDRYIK